MSLIPFQKGSNLSCDRRVANLANYKAWCVHITGNYGENIFTTSESSRERHYDALKILLPFGNWGVGKNSLPSYLNR